VRLVVILTFLEASNRLYTPFYLTLGQACRTSFKLLNILCGAFNLRVNPGRQQLRGPGYGSSQWLIGRCPWLVIYHFLNLFTISAGLFTWIEFTWWHLNPLLERGARPQMDYPTLQVPVARTRFQVSHRRRHLLFRGRMAPQIFNGRRRRNWKHHGRLLAALLLQRCVFELAFSFPGARLRSKHAEILLLLTELSTVWGVGQQGRIV
jgi:hypothetical protein